jgi:hypothetical protein
MTSIPPVIELRQYTLHPGQRDVLIALFEREFVEPQEAAGLRVVGTFRDLDDPDRYVWLRGFADLAMRPVALAAFYDGPVWQRHRTAANATMVDSDDVLLLRAVNPQAQVGAAGVVTATICPLGAGAPDALVSQFERLVRPQWLAAGADWLVGLVTDTAPNNYPRLPVREGESAIVWLSGFADEAAQRRHTEQLAALPEWAAWRTHLAAAPQTLQLAPTARSAIAPAFIGRPGDFDFLVGRWAVRNRRLKARHVGSTDWDEFDAVNQAWTHLNGLHRAHAGPCHGALGHPLDQQPRRPLGTAGARRLLWRPGRVLWRRPGRGPAGDGALPLGAPGCRPGALDAGLRAFRWRLGDQLGHGDDAHRLKSMPGVRVAMQSLHGGGRPIDMASAYSLAHMPAPAPRARRAEAWTTGI